MRRSERIENARLDPGANATINDLRRAAGLTGAVGAVFSILFIASLWLLNSAPRAHESDDVFIAFYSGDERKKIVAVGLYVLPLAAVAFIWFIAALRQWVAHSRRRGSQMLGTVQLVSGVAFITLSLASAAASTMPAALSQLTKDAVDPDIARDFPLYGNALLLVFGVRMGAIFVMTTTSISTKSGFMPKWFSALSVLVALVLFLSATLSFFLAVLFPLWVLALGILIIYHAYHTAADSPMLRRVRAVGEDDLPQGDDIIEN